MSNRDTILAYLNENRQSWCDDCLSARTGIMPRQQVNQICRDLLLTHEIRRERVACEGCGSFKVVNYLGDGQPITSRSTKAATNKMPLSGKGHPWYWEGNVQSKLVSHLVKNGYHIMSVANTDSRTKGKDIEASTPSGKILWVSVKGYPDKSSYTQARHWFSQAMFDMILYREQSDSAQLAVAFPDGFNTYNNLSQRIGWFMSACGFKIYWVSENGSVRED
jgi:hypothetical protein